MGHKFHIQAHLHPSPPNPFKKNIMEKKKKKFNMLK